MTRCGCCRCGRSCLARGRRLRQCSSTRPAGARIGCVAGVGSWWCRRRRIWWPWQVACLAVRRCRRRCCSSSVRAMAPPRRTAMRGGRKAMSDPRRRLRRRSWPGRWCVVVRRRTRRPVAWLLRIRRPRARPGRRRGGATPGTHLPRIVAGRAGSPRSPAGGTPGRQTLVMGVPGRPRVMILATSATVSSGAMERRVLGRRGRPTQGDQASCGAPSRRTHRPGAHALAPTGVIVVDTRVCVAGPGLQPAHVRHRERCTPPW